MPLAKRWLQTRLGIARCSPKPDSAGFSRCLDCCLKGSLRDTQVLATLRRELFRTLLLQRIDFFDRHDPAELTALISNELDSLRSLVFK